MDKIFKPKVDKLVIVRSAFILMVLPIMLLILGSWNTTIAAGVFITECLLLIPFGIILPLRTTYKVTPDGLLIVPAGIRSIRIDIRDITSIKLGNSWNEFFFSSYVNSLDQLKLSYKKNSKITISPVEKEAFIRALQNKNLRLHIISEEAPASRYPKK